MPTPKNRSRRTSSARYRLLVAGGAGLVLLVAGFLFLSTHRERQDLPKASAIVMASTQGALPIPVQVGEARVSANGTEANAPLISEAIARVEPAAYSKLRVLNEILASRNDNDPRMDTELRVLSPVAKKALRARYRELRREDRNGLGTIAFLLGRNIESDEDLEFLASILMEAPCLSLEDCSRAMREARGEDSHRDAGVEVTLNYPSLTVLNSIEKRLLEEKTHPLVAEVREKVRQILVAVKAAPVPAVAKKAEELVRRFF